MNKSVRVWYEKERDVTAVLLTFATITEAAREMVALHRMTGMSAEPILPLTYAIGSPQFVALIRKLEADHA